jgi:hypothetical protein
LRRWANSEIASPSDRFVKIVDLPSIATDGIPRPQAGRFCRTAVEDLFDPVHRPAPLVRRDETESNPAPLHQLRLERGETGIVHPLARWHGGADHARGQHQPDSEAQDQDQNSEVSHSPPLRCGIRINRSLRGHPLPAPPGSTPGRAGADRIGSRTELSTSNSGPQPGDCAPLPCRTHRPARRAADGAFR